MAMTLPPNLSEQVEEIMSRGNYADAEEVISHALALLADEERFVELKAVIDASAEDVAQGRVSRLTPELIAGINAEAEEMFRRGVVPDPNVTF